MARHPFRRRASWVKAYEIKDISGLTHGVGWCAPQQGACKLTLNVKNGIIEEALVETHRLLGHDAFRRHGRRDPAGQDHSGGAEHRPCVRRHQRRHARDCSCRSSTAAARPRFPRTACPSAPSLEDLGKGLRSAGGHHLLHQGQGRALPGAGGGLYHSAWRVDENNEAIGYKFVRLGKMMEDIRHGVDPKSAYEKNIGTYGRYADAPKYIDPREE